MKVISNKTMKRASHTAIIVGARGGVHEAFPFPPGVFLIPAEVGLTSLSLMFSGGVGLTPDVKQKMPSLYLVVGVGSIPADVATT